MIDHDRLKEVLHYDPDTGAFTWLVRTSNRIRVGDVAGRTCKDGYRRIGVDGIDYLEHRLAWFYMTGEWPEPEIDHRDGHTENNRWSNFREATRGQNTANSRLRKGKTLPKGVSFRASSGRFLAQIVHKRETIYLGSFSTPEQAHGIYMTAARDLHGEFARAS